MSLLLTYSIRSLWARRATTLATALGVALVVFVLAASLMLASGIRETLLSAGAADHVLVLQVDGYNEAGSQIRQTSLGLVAAAPGVVRSKNGSALVAGEVVAHVYLGKVNNVEDMASIQVRGVTPDSFEVRPNVRLVAGRLAKPGTNEAIVGKALLSGDYAGVRLGEGFALKKNRELAIVGVFEAARSAYESEVWADLDMVRDAFGMKGRLSSVTAALEDPMAFDAFKQTLEADKRLGLSVERERSYYEKVSNGLSASIGGLGMLISVIFAFGAALGALITMYGQVAQRRTEVGVLRAMRVLPQSRASSVPFGIGAARSVGRRRRRVVGAADTRHRLLRGQLGQRAIPGVSLPAVRRDGGRRACVGRGRWYRWWHFSGCKSQSHQPGGCDASSLVPGRTRSVAAARQLVLFCVARLRSCAGPNVGQRRCATSW